MVIFLDDFLTNIVNIYNEEELKLIKKALIYADNKHSGQMRKSGEPYIIHPIAVADKLVSFNADCNIVCAALLHDVLEDTNTSKEELKQEFNNDIAYLVDGVTKFKDDGVSSKQELKEQYIRKVTTSILSDVRVIIIKLMDRLHNMETLNYQSRDKQKKIAKETLEIYVPLAYYLGMYQIRFLLEDLAFKYLNPVIYKKIESKRNDIIKDGSNLLDEITSIISDEIKKNEIDANLEKNTKNVYGIYKRMKKGTSINNVSDILRIKIIVNNLSDCYKVLGIVHTLFHPINNRFKDYISNPKTNKYQSLHTTIFTGNNYFVQIQIRTKEMDDIDQYGILSEWLKRKENSDITKYLWREFPFISLLNEINNNYPDDFTFMEKLNNKILKEKIYVTIGNGNIIEIPKDFTLRDLGNHLNVDASRLLVNNDEKNMMYVLRNNDHISTTKGKVKKINYTK